MADKGRAIYLREEWDIFIKIILSATTLADTRGLK